MMNVSYFAAGVAFFLLVATVAFLRCTLLDAVDQIEVLRRRVEELEAYRDGLRVMFARSAERRERSNGGAS